MLQLRTKLHLLRPVPKIQGLGTKLVFFLALLHCLVNQALAADVDSLEPLAASEWSYDHAAHLLERA